MNNESLQAFIDEFGDRMCIIIFDNNTKVFIGYKSSPAKSVSDLQLVNKGGVDFVGVPGIPNDPKLARKGVTYTVWRPTEIIQGIVTLDEGFDNYLVDPWDLG